MRTWYAIRHPALVRVLRAVDALLSLRPRAPVPPATALQARRVLVAMPAHIGDAIVATAVIPGLQQRFAGAELGFLVHPQGAMVARTHPGIRWVHTVEHWNLNRRGESLPRRWWRYRGTRRRALREIRDVGYDVAIDLYHHFPNALPLLSTASIPSIVGWRSGGFGPLATHPLDHDGGTEPILHRHARVLAALGLPMSDLRPDLPLAPAARDGWAALAGAHGLPADPVLLHVGGHGAHRRWTDEGWTGLARELVRQGQPVALLGQGPQDAALCARIAAVVDGTVDLCDRLDWPAWQAATASARLLVAHDSAAIHVAAAYDTPRIACTPGIADWRIWMAESARSRVMTHPMPCAPCGRRHGCEHMRCIRGIALADVVEAARRLLAAGGRPADQNC